ncbi:AAA family ATPase [Micromonospora sp. NPDC047074]|uniref:AAA family ATPase n=1 Tax=Micromonospora sp. NPDC047074 TaxID=3154339 RepID=UPI0033D111D3
MTVGEPALDAPGPTPGSAPQRVVVIGTSGAGKSTLSEPLARWIGAEHIELDGIQHGPNWAQTPIEVFRERVAERAQQPRWVFDGNYIDKVSQTLWPLADTVIWLDIPLRVILPRLARRSLSRILRGTELWSGNREGWSALLGRNSVLLWAVRSHRRHQRELPERLAALAGTGTRVVRLRSSAEADRWLADVTDPKRS